MLNQDLVKSAKEMGEANDCSVKALATICDLPYKMAHDHMAGIGRVFRCGFRPDQAIKNLGYQLHQLAHLKSKTIRTLERELAAEFGGLKVLIYCSRGRHVLAWDGAMIADWTGGRQQRVCLNRVYLCFKGSFLEAMQQVGQSVPVPARAELAPKNLTRTAVYISCEELDVWEQQYSSVAAAYKALGFHLRGHQRLRRALKKFGEARGYALYADDGIRFRNVRIEMKAKKD